MMPLRVQSGRARDARRIVTVSLVALFSAAILLHSSSADAQSGRVPGTIKGQVLVADSTGSACVPGSLLVLNGPENLKAESDANGQFNFPRVLPGAYVIEASAPGLEGQLSVSVDPGQVANVSLKLELVAATSTVTVTANAPSTDITTATQTVEEKTIDDAPNADERFETLLPLVPGVVRGPDGRINMKGVRNTQSGALVNSSNVTDPASGGPAINLPIDVVSSVQVISDPFDPQYGKFTGALSTVETKTGDYDKPHLSIQNVVPRWRDRAGTIAGLGAATPRVTFTGPLVPHRAAITQSFEYRFIRTPVNSLPPLQRDTKLEGFNSYTQADIAPNSRQTATVSLAVYPQKLDYMGLNTFTPQPSTADFRQRGYQVYAQHRYFPSAESALVSQFSYKTYDVDINAQSDDTYQLLIDTTKGGFFNRQNRRTSRFESVESYQFAPREFLGSHQFKAGWDYAHSNLRGLETSLPVEIVGSSGNEIERIGFSTAPWFDLDQNETAFYLSDQWTVSSRLSLNGGVRLDSDTITSSTHVAPRGGVVLSLTGDGKTLLKGGAGIFYDRVPLLLPAFPNFPSRTVTLMGPGGQVLSSTAFVNRIAGPLENPRSTAWNAEVDRQFTTQFAVRVAYENRNTARDLVVSPISRSESGVIALSNTGSDSYREFQIAGRYQIPRMTLNGSYVHSRAYGDLNDPFLFFGNYPQAVIQPDQKGRLLFDAPNRELAWADVQGPWKLTIAPVYDIHTGFPYSVQNEYRDYVGPRSSKRFPRFASADVQITRPFAMHVRDKELRMRVGGSALNVFNHDNPRDVQNDLDSSTFGSFYNDAWREYRGKLVFEF
jgi:outer membrane receptor protein involved in Fe transport